MATNEGGRAPRAVIHKRILESAESDPNASLEALARDVAGASPDLVERVLDEYGDPGESTTGSAETTEKSPMPEPASTPSDAELTERQRETLEAIARFPEATQSELAEALDVSRATVNKRLNAIEGFDWGDRLAFVETVLDGDPVEPLTRSPDPPTESNGKAAVDGGQLLSPDADQAIEQLQERVARIEQQLDASTGATPPAIADGALVTKVLRAVMAADDITEDEEVAVVEALR